MRKLISVTVLVFVILLSPIAYATSQFGIQGRLYLDGHPETGNDGAIIGLASWKHFIYVSWRDQDGEQTLDVWNVRNTTQPLFIRSYDFGNINDDLGGILRDAHLRAPRDLTVIDGNLLLWSYKKLFAYQPTDDGQLLLIYQRSFADGLNRGLRRLNFAGNYATTDRTLLTNREFLDLPPGDERRRMLHMNAFMNFTDPLNPYLMKVARPVGLNLLVDSENINATQNDLPSILSVNREDMTATLKIYSHELTEHVNDFWESKFGYIFNAASFDLSLTVILENILADINLPQVQNQLITGFATNLNLPDASTIADLIRGKYEGNVRLADVLEDYNIDPSDSLEVALEKYIEAYIDAEFDAQISRTLLPNLLQIWRDSFFNLNDVSIDELKAGLIAAMNFEIDDISAGDYFVERVVAPLLGNPEYLTWRMRDLVNSLANSRVAGVIDNGLVFINDTIDRAKRIMNSAFIPFSTIVVIAENLSGRNFDIDVDAIDIPECFQIADSSTDLLELVLYNRGARLDPDGLAFIETLKLGQYFEGNDDYLDFDLDLGDLIRSAHAQLANNMFTSLFGSIDPAFLGGSNINALFEKYADTLSLKKVISKSVSQAFIQYLKRADVPIDLSLKEILVSYDLYVKPFEIPAGQSMATVDDFIAQLTALNLADTTVESILNYAKEATLTPLKSAYKEVLIFLNSEMFGSVQANATLRELLANYITDHVNGGRIIGDLLREAMGRILITKNNGLSITQWMSKLERSDRGDCMAQWSVTLDTITTTLTVMQNFDPTTILTSLNITTMTLNAAIENLYEMAIEYAVDEMVNELVVGIMQDADTSYESWYSRLSVQTQNFDLNQLASFRPEHINGFGFKNKIAFVLRNVDVIGPSANHNPDGQISLLIFDQNDPQGTAQEIDLGRWSAFYKMHQAGQYLYLGGSKVVNGRRQSTAILIDMENNPTKPIQMHGSHAIFLNVAEDMIMTNGGQNLAVRGANDQVFLLPIPGGSMAINELGVVNNADDANDNDPGAGNDGGDDVDVNSDDDGSALDPGSNMNSGASSGCSLSQASGTNGLFWLLFMLPAMALFVRRFIHSAENHC